jgi:hypothetical protein
MPFQDGSKIAAKNSNNQTSTQHQAALTARSTPMFRHRAELRPDQHRHRSFVAFGPPTPGAVGMMHFMKSSNKGTVKAVSP